MKKLVVNPGDKFGRLTYVEESIPYKLPSGAYARIDVFKCECGTIKPINFSSVKSGKVVSCGCYLAERLVVCNTKHGLTETYEYLTLRNVINRCNDPKNKSYQDYGGRGIKCLLKSVSDIVDDIGFRPSKNHSIDRINNNGHYEKGNIRWATRKEQNNNTRKSKYITFGGETLTQAQWADKLGIDPRPLHYRLKSGWCIECAFTLPYDKNRNRCSHK